MLSSCGSSNDTKNKIEYVPFQEEEGALWGMISVEDGSVLFKDEFQKCPSNVYNGRFWVQNERGFFELYEASAKPKRIGSEEYVFVGDFSDDVTPVRSEAYIDLIDKNANVIKTLDKIEGKHVRGCGPFREGLAMVYVEDRDHSTNDIGFINTKGEVAIPANYCWATAFHGGVAIVIDKELRNKPDSERMYSIIDKTGKVLTQYSSKELLNLTRFENGISTRMDKNKECTIVDKNGNIIATISDKINAIGEIEYGYFAYEKDGLLGIGRASDGELIIRPKYNFIRIVGKNAFVGGKANKEDYSLMNMNEEEIYKHIKNAHFFSDEPRLIPVEVSSNYWLFISTKGEEIKSKTGVHRIEYCDALPEGELVISNQTDN